MTEHVTSAEQLRSFVGRRVESSSWHVVDQRMIDMFAEVTGDRQWIHVDPLRAQSGPFGNHYRPRLPHPVSDSPSARETHLSLQVR